MALTIASPVGVVLQAPPLIHRQIHRRFATAVSLPLLRKQSFSLRISTPQPRFRVSAAVSPTTQSPLVEPLTSLTGATRTVTTIVTLAFSVARLFASSLLKQVGLLSSPVAAIGAGAGPLFFAAMDSRPSPYLNTPLTVVAAGLAKWLDIYSGVLMVRVLLSWFPNIPWDRQPLSAIRDLCDPYLSLFRNIIPPVFNTLDVSPLLAFAILGLLGSILKSS